MKLLLFILSLSFACLSCNTGNTVEIYESETKELAVTQSSLTRKAEKVVSHQINSLKLEFINCPFFLRYHFSPVNQDLFIKYSTLLL